MPRKRETAEPHHSLEQRSLPKFLLALGSELDALERDPLPAYGLTNELALAYVNRAWDLAAARSKTPAPWPLGLSVRAALGPLEGSFVNALERAAERGSASLPYECPTPTKRRRYLATLQHLGSGRGYLIRNQLLLAERAEPSAVLPVAAYRDARGLIRQCANCRRTGRPGAEHVWDWVPELLEPNVLQVSHGLCESCIRDLYPELE